MIPLTALWLPILLSVVIVFFASFIMHMVLAYHKSDYRKLPDEDRVTNCDRQNSEIHFESTTVCDRSAVGQLFSRLLSTLTCHARLLAKTFGVVSTKEEPSTINNQLSRATSS